MTTTSHTSDMHAVRAEAFSDVEAFVDARARWESVMQAAGGCPLYLRHAWIDAWWRSFGTDADVCCVLLSDDDGPLGVAAFCDQRFRLGPVRLRTLRLMGNDLSPRSEVVLLRRERAAWSALVRLIMARRWHWFDVGRAPAECCTLRLLSDTPEFFHVAERERVTLPLVDVSRPWETWLAGRSRTFRKTIRKAEEKTAGMTLTSYPGEIPTLAALLDALERVASESWTFREGTAIVSDASTRAFFHRLIEAFAASGEFIASLLTDRDVPVAFAFGVRSGSTVYGLKTSFVESGGAASLGTRVMAGFVMACTRDVHAQTMDMDGADAAGGYKLRWADRLETLEVWRVFRPAPLSALLAGVYRLRKSARGAGVAAPQASLD